MAQHGTHARYVEHRRNREKACDKCLSAHRQVTARSQIIRDRARRRLAGMFPAVMDALVAEETDRYDQEAS